MELREFIKLFSDQFDDTDVELFVPDTKFKDLDEWSSLTALSVISMVDEEMEKPLSGSDLRKANTIKELYDLIQSK